MCNGRVSNSRSISPGWGGAPREEIPVEPDEDDGVWHIDRGERVSNARVGDGVAALANART
jgi:hypothetical protein